MPGKNFLGIDPLKVLKGGLIGAGVGLALGSGVTVAKTLRSKQEPESRDLSVQTLNLDMAAPDLIPVLVNLEGFVKLVPAEHQAAWRQACGTLIHHCDAIYNTLVRVAKREVVNSFALVAEVEVRSKHVTIKLIELSRLLPENLLAPPKSATETENPTDFNSLRKEIEENVQTAWINFKNSL